MHPNPADTDSPPEHWQTDAGSASVAMLNIPGVLTRARVFDVDVTLVVDVPATSASPSGAGAGPWHELTVEFDGQRQWSRRIPSHSPGQTDGLDYHQRVRLEGERALKVRAVVKVKGSRIRRLLIEAREEA